MEIYESSAWHLIFTAMEHQVSEIMKQRNRAHEQYGKDVAYVVLNQKSSVLVDGTYNGFDDVVKKKIIDSLHLSVQEPTGNSKRKLDNWQKYMENGNTCEVRKSQRKQIII